jgi:hypothetical protein
MKKEDEKREECLEKDDLNKYFISNILNQELLKEHRD